MIFKKEYFPLHLTANKIYFQGAVLYTMKLKSFLFSFKNYFSEFQYIPLLWKWTHESLSWFIVFLFLIMSRWTIIYRTELQSIIYYRSKCVRETNLKFFSLGAIYYNLNPLRRNSPCRGKRTYPTKTFQQGASARRARLSAKATTVRFSGSSRM